MSLLREASVRSGLGRSPWYPRSSPAVQQRFETQAQPNAAPELSMRHLSHTYGFSIDLRQAQGVLGKVPARPCHLDVEKVVPVPLVPKETMCWDELGRAGMRCAGISWHMLE